MPEGLAAAIISIGSFLLVCAFYFDRWLYRKQQEIDRKLAETEKQHQDRLREEAAIYFYD